MRQSFSRCLSAHASVQRNQQEQLCTMNVALKNVIWRRFANIVNGGGEMMIYVNHLTTVVD